MAQPYMTFVRKNQQKLHELLIDEDYVLEVFNVRSRHCAISVENYVIKGVFQLWYKKLMKMMSTWLCERASQQLHIFQLVTLSTILKVTNTSTCSQPDTIESFPETSQFLFTEWLLLCFLGLEKIYFESAIGDVFFLQTTVSQKLPIRF